MYEVIKVLNAIAKSKYGDNISDASGDNISIKTFIENKPDFFPAVLGIKEEIPEVKNLLAHIEKTNGKRHHLRQSK